MTTLYLPTRSFREYDIVLVFVPISFYKFDASKILPVPHCLLKEGLVHSAKISVYFVRYNAVVPHPLLPSGSSSGYSTVAVVVPVIRYRVFPFEIEVWLEFVNGGFLGVIGSASVFLSKIYC